MFSNNSVVSIFDKKPLTTQDGKEYGFNCRVSTSSRVKNKDGNYAVDENGKTVYKQDFGGFVRFVGKAYNYLKDVEIDTHAPAKVMIKSCGVQSYVKTNEVGAKSYPNIFLVFDAGEPQFNKSNENSEEKDSANNPLPF